MRSLLLSLLAALLLALPVSGAADERGLDGALVALATATPADPGPARSPMLLTDRVKTAERAFARLLLGGRVMVLAREHSSLRITEVPGAATIDVEGGRVAVTVDRENLHPEDLVEVRTPHAVASVQADTLIIEVRGGASTFTVFGARVDVFRLEPATGAVLEPPTPVTGESVVTIAPSAASTDVASR
jgi:hypothetical protein